MVVGSAGAIPRRWTAALGWENLWPQAGDRVGIARSASFDGSVIVGEASFIHYFKVFQYTDQGGLTEIGGPAGSEISTVLSVSADGAAIGGFTDFSGTYSVFRWTQADGFVLLGALPGGTDSIGGAISADGSTVVGESNGRPFRWTMAAGMEALGLPQGFGGAYANGVSGDGSIIVGELDAGAAIFAFRWTRETGMQNLGIVGHADCISANGAVIAGSSNTGTGSGPAFIWTAQRGYANLETLLGPALPPGWSRLSVRGISADGLRIVGSGRNPAGQSEAWLITLTPDLISCYPNCDTSTVPPILNINDFICFLNRFSAGDNYANCDGSTFPPALNVNDFTCFLNKFASGCG